MTAIIQTPVAAKLCIARASSAKLVITAKQYIPAVIGESFGGGYFGGYISHTADGNPTHALIVAPRATGATGTGYELTANLQWKTTSTTTVNTTSTFDGFANTAAMVAAGITAHPAAQFCVNLSIGGFTDWYLPARYEWDIVYFNLKPTTAANSVNDGINPYSVPRRNVNFTANNPAQTFIAAFVGADAFAASAHWSSSEFSAVSGWDLSFATGAAEGGGKTNGRRVRAIRRIAL